MSSLLKKVQPDLFTAYLSYIAISTCSYACVIVMAAGHQLGHQLGHHLNTTFEIFYQGPVCHCPSCPQNYERFLTCKRSYEQHQNKNDRNSLVGDDFRKARVTRNKTFVEPYPYTIYLLNSCKN